MDSKSVMMMLALLTTGLTVYLMSQNNQSDKKYYKEFLKFKSEYGKLHASLDEFNFRYKIFADNMKMIEEHNSLNKSFKMGVTPFTELTFDEFKAKYLSKSIPNETQAEVLTTVQEETGNVDWRKSDNVTPVKNQMSCGSCWAFSTTGSMESALSIFKNQNVQLSEQELVDCSTSYGNNGCNGGLMNMGFDYIKDHKIATEGDYPYEGYDNQCRNSDDGDRYTVVDYNQISPINVNGLMKALKQQPVSVAIEARQDFMHYTEGVYTAGSSCGQQLNHGVLSVGFSNDSSNEENYFIVKNSWSDKWGEKGYIRMAVGKGSGTCGIANQAAVYPTVQQNQF